MLQLIFGPVITILITLCAIIIAYFKWSFTYWKKRNVPFIEPTIPFGSSENPFKRKDYIGVRIKKRYDEFKSQGHKHGGLYLFTSPNYMPIHPEYIKNIMARDFKYFMNRGMYYNEKEDPLSAHLFTLEGQRWKNLRNKLTPTFTSGKMKMMFPTLVECSRQLINAVDKSCKKQEPVDIKDVSSCFTTDVIGSCAFGLECNSFIDPDSDFRRHGRKMFTSVSKSRSLQQVITLASPTLGHFLGIALTPKEVTEFFLNVVEETVEFRKRTNTVRKDFLQILIDLKDVNSNVESFTMKELAAQAFVFFLAGFETSSTTMSFCLFELAMNNEVQQRVRNEIFDVLKMYDGEVTYEAVMEMKYLGQAVDETLRKYPPAALMTRVCNEDYQVPGTDVTIEEGTRVLIPIYALHHDPEFYPSPEEFDPDRFSEKSKSGRHPFTYLPFGEGPRICIGLRFGLMQTKVGLAALLKNYHFSVSDKTKLPLEIDPTNLALTSKDVIWLEVNNLVN